MTEKDNINWLDLFCKSGDPRFLAHLDQFTSTLLHKIAFEIRGHNGVRSDLVNVILDYYSIDHKTGRFIGVPENRDKAAKYVDDFSVALTGARVGDVLAGAAPASKGAVMKVHKEDIAPYKKDLDIVRASPDLWDKFIVKLGSIPFFANMTASKREIWLYINESHSDNNIGDEGACFEIIQGGNIDLDPDLLNILSQPNPDSEDGYWSGVEITNMFPRKAGSKAKPGKHTLILLSSRWRVTVDYEIVKSYKGCVADISGGELRVDWDAAVSEEIYIFRGLALKFLTDGKTRIQGIEGAQSLGVLTSTDRFSPADVDSVILNIFPDCDIECIRKTLKNFPPSAYKSLMQKIIRFRPTSYVVAGKAKYPVEHFLVCVMAFLAANPGAFVPDIQRFVTGIESFTKRLAIIVYEDSYVTQEYHPLIASLLFGALAAQRVRSWLPNQEQLTRWLKFGLHVYRSTVAVDSYKHNNLNPYVVQPNQPLLHTCSAILDELKSFDGDLQLARNFAFHYPDVDLIEGGTAPESMEIYHCVDQHWATGVVHYFDPSYVRKVCANPHTGIPYGELMTMIWNKASSVNFRRGSIFDKADTDVQNIQYAQEMFLHAKQVDHRDRPETDEIIEVSYTLDRSWIAGMVGALEVKHRNVTMLVTMNINDPMDLKVIRRPSREMTDTPLPENSVEYAKNAARKRLRDGVPMNQTNTPIPEFSGMKAFLIEGAIGGDYYMVGRSKLSAVPWENVRHVKLTVPVHEARNFDCRTALSYVGSGVQENADEQLSELLGSTSYRVVKRALGYISTYNRKFELNRVSKDGSGTYKAVSVEDTAVYRFLLHLSWLYPGALRPALHKPSAFTVPVGPLLWMLRDKIRGMIVEDVYGAGWRDVMFKNNTQKLWPHQREMVDTMIARSNVVRGNFIWVPVGTGKTLAVLTYIQYLRDTGKLPPYVVYTLPTSAVTSIIKEVHRFGLHVNLVIPITGYNKKAVSHKKAGVTISSSCTLVPYAVNLIEHDYLRLCENELLKLAEESFFVVDEVHKTLNDTKRTSVALEIADVSKDFLVLTGTAVIDSNTSKLISWLEQIVPFEVNTKNFWVAATSMIAKKVDTGIAVEKENVLSIMTPEENESYKNLIPASLGGRNPKPTQKALLAASDICYTACNRDIIKAAMRLNASSRGVMVVAKDSTHQKTLYDMFLKAGMKISDIYVLTTGESIDLTDESVESGETQDYRIVIVPIRRAEGYTLTRLSAMVTSVYPSNNATREQIEGRINRLSQKNPSVVYVTVHTGLLTSILRNHNDAANLSKALKGLAKTITSNALV